MRKLEYSKGTSYNKKNKKIEIFNRKQNNKGVEFSEFKEENDSEKNNKNNLENIKQIFEVNF